MAQKFSNAARAELSAAIDGSATSVTIVGGGELFPVADTDTASISPSADWFKAVLQDSDGVEVVYVRTHGSASNTFSNVLRGQEGTTARAFNAGAVFGLRPTAGDAEDFATRQHATTVGSTPPPGLVEGQEWVDDTTGIKYTLVDGALVELGPSGVSPDVAVATHAAPAKPTPADADELGYVDSAAGWGLVKLTWANLKAALSNFFLPKTGGTLTGDLNFSGAGRRITGDFSNATISSRTMFQTNSLNTGTSISAIPSGTGNYSEVILYSASDLLSAFNEAKLLVSATEVSLRSAPRNGAAATPLTFYTGGAERLRIDTSGNVLVTGGGGLGYGVGAGGTAVQSPNNTSPVPINKQNGTIYLANGTIAGSGVILFELQNTFITANSIVVVHGSFAGTGAGVAQFTPQVNYVQTGLAVIQIKNNSAAPVPTDGVTIRFAVFAGSAA